MTYCRTAEKVVTIGRLRLPRYETNTPTVFVRPLSKAVARLLGRYPTLRAAAKTRCRVFSATSPSLFPLSTYETVAWETQAIRATSTLLGFLKIGLAIILLIGIMLHFSFNVNLLQKNCDIIANMRLCHLTNTVAVFAYFEVNCR